jgi:SagB-type dehydrogenase family enzyme
MPPAGLLATNFMAQSSFACGPLSVDILARAADWTPAASLLDSYPPALRPVVDAELRRLVDGQGIVVAGTRAADDDIRYEQTWAWTESAGFYHFSLKRAQFLPTAMINPWLEYRTRHTPAPPLAHTNARFGAAIPLDRPETDEGVLAVMSKRRSERTFSDEPLSLKVLSDCLYAGLGVVGFFDMPIEGHDPLPLTMTPSGGGRNPYEAYVDVLRVDGLRPGIYHYSALEHSLAPAGMAAPPPPRELLGGQEWTDGAAAVIFLVAHFGRTMWKYPHPSAYRVVLIEAGHIGQNIALAAAAHDAVAIPVAALNDALDSTVLGVDFVSDSVVCGLVLGGRLPPDDPRPFERQHIRLR